MRPEPVKQFFEEDPAPRIQIAVMGENPRGLLGVRLTFSSSSEVRPQLLQRRAGSGEFFALAPQDRVSVAD